mmetsp:Transcript_1746/g.3293  ORF Transcript_1746/g.3293 Transcript_1746/m.3293 type:complete len:693 (-) Transcript_1746:314-2392(-)
MNAKSERIEHLIQIVNRNLLLIYNGQVEGVTPVDPATYLTSDKSGKNTTTSSSGQKVEMSVFDGDKFGYEMVNFFRSYVKTNKSTLAAIWERNFVKGVETLMMECAVIKDSLERECFVSRVYVWFNEKLVERRDLPGQNDIQYDEIALLKNTMSAMGAFHSVKALENLTEQKAKADSEVLQRVLAPETEPKESMAELGLEGQGIDKLKLPPITAPKTAKHPEPVKVEDRPPIDSDGYVPETEAEKVMHELWLARRRQEAFEWKARQNLNLIMDRRDLHRSRLESEALRREETSSYLAGPQNSDDLNLLGDSTLSDNSRFVPSLRRPLSGKRHFANIITDIELDDEIQSTKQAIETSGALEATSLQEINKSIQTTTINIVKDGAAEEKVKVNNVARKVVPKNIKKPYVPMRFRSKAPDSFTAGTNSRNKRESFSADANKTNESTQVPNTVASTPKPEVKEPTATSTAVPRSDKSQKPNDVKRKSSKIMQTMGANDSELQVHYVYSVSRKGPLSAKHNAWLKEQADARTQCDLAYNRKLRRSSETEPPPPPPKKNEKDETKDDASDGPKYSSAQDFMNKHFPIFDRPENDKGLGALRKQQLQECDEVMESYECWGGCEESELEITREALEKGLLIPQDRPTTICMEGLKDNVEGLMVNPLPKELWRKANIISSSGGGGGGGATKKKKKPVGKKK